MPYKSKTITPCLHAYMHLRLYPNKKLARMPSPVDWYSKDIKRSYRSQLFTATTS